MIFKNGQLHASSPLPFISNGQSLHDHHGSGQSLHDHHGAVSSSDYMPYVTD